MWNIDLIWLNRIGIVLNFLAGFLMAPDLIGRKRLKEFEIALEERLKGERNFFTSLYKKFEIESFFPFLQSPDKPPNYIFGPKEIYITTLIGLTLSPAFWYLLMHIKLKSNLTVTNVLFLIGWVVLFYIVAFFISVTLFSVAERFPYNILEYAALLWFFITLLIVWGVLIGIVLLIGYILPRLFTLILSYIVSRMETAEDALTSYLLICGIVFFIIGNLLQFLATLNDANK